MTRMGRPKTARGLRDDAVLELLDQLSDLQAVADAIEDVKRRIAHINRRRVAALGSLREAQNADLDDAARWDGSERRRHGDIVALMEQAATSEIAAVA